MKDKKIILIIISIVIIIGIIVAILVFNKKGEKNNKLIMVTEAGFAPYEFYEGDQIVGVDVEIANKIAEKMGKELEIKDIDFDSIINEIKSGKADFGAAGLSITEERLQEVDFSIEYATSKQVIIVKNDSSINGPDDLHGKKVAVQLGTVADLVLSDEYEDTEIVQHKKYLLAVEDLLAGKVDALVIDSLPGKEIVNKNQGLKIADNELLTDKYGIAIKKGNTELLKTINEVLEDLIKQGKIEEYTIKYLGE